MISESLSTPGMDFFYHLENHPPLLLPNTLPLLVFVVYLEVLMALWMDQVIHHCWFSPSCFMVKAGHIRDGYVSQTGPT